jgi:hypothetical protein
MTCVKQRIQQDFIARTKQKQNRALTKKIPKIGVHTKGN